MPFAQVKASEVVGLRGLSTGGLEVGSLSPKVQEYVKRQMEVCQPESVHVCDGSESENKALLDKLEKDGRIQKLEKYDNW